MRVILLSWVLLLLGQSEPATLPAGAPASASAPAPTSASTPAGEPASTSAPVATSTPARGPTSTSAPASAPATASAPAAPEAAAAQAPDSPFNYRLIVDRNIFARDRHAAAVSRPAAAVSQPTTQEASAALVLIGVAVRDEVRLAFFEDSRNGSTLPLAVGGMLEGGKILSVSLEGVEVSLAGGIRKLLVGDSLSGQRPTTEPASQPAGESASGENAAEGGSDSEIIKRMRQRRLQELRR